MNKLIISFAILCSVTPPLQAQFHDNVWYAVFWVDHLDTTATGIDSIYVGTQFDFNTGDSVISPLTVLHGCYYSTRLMSDSLGRPLFYTDGFHVYDPAGHVLPNGYTINPTLFSHQEYDSMDPGYGQILPINGKKDSYYILHYDQKNGYFGLKDFLYTKVVANVDSARVVFKSKKILENRKLWEMGAVKHANGRDWWIVAPERDSSNMTYNNVFLATADSVFQVHRFAVEPPLPMYFLPSSNIFTPDGSRFMEQDIFGGVKIWDFDRCTGVLSNPYFLSLETPMGVYVGALSVSPNSRYLYVFLTLRALQFDLYAPDLAASVDTIITLDSTYYPSFVPGVEVFSPYSYSQLAPNGQIYIYPFGGSLAMSVIRQPNRPGAACNFSDNTLSVPWPIRSVPFYPNYRLGPIDGSACDTLGYDNHPLANYNYFGDSTLQVVFEDNSYYDPAVWLWDFGDGGSSADTSPVHLFPHAGVYQVCLTVSNAYGSDTQCKWVTVGSSRAQEAQSAGFVVQVSPNPAGDYALVQYAGAPEAKGLFELFDWSGKRVFEYALHAKSGQFALPVKALPVGLYSWVIRTGAQGLRSGKVQVMR